MKRLTKTDEFDKRTITAYFSCKDNNAPASQDFVRHTRACVRIVYASAGEILARSYPLSNTHTSVAPCRPGLRYLRDSKNAPRPPGGTNALKKKRVALNWFRRFRRKSERKKTYFLPSTPRVFTPSANRALPYTKIV